MSRSITSRIEAIALAVVLGTGLAANAPAQAQNSGFLKDYSQLKTEKDPLGTERRIWTSPKLTGANYKQVLMEPIVFHPAPEPSNQVSMGALNDIRAYADSATRKAISSVVPTVETPGPGVLRVRVAITAVAVEGSFKPYQLVPVALVVTGAKEAAGAGRRDLKLFVETEITDSVSGEPLARIVREAQGIQMKSGDKLTLQQAKPQIDVWAEGVRQSLAARLKPDGR